MRSPRERPADSSAATFDSLVLLLGGPLGPTATEPLVCTGLSLPLPPFFECDDVDGVGWDGLAAEAAVCCGVADALAAFAAR